MSALLCPEYKTGSLDGVSSPAPAPRVPGDLGYYALVFLDFEFLFVKWKWGGISIWSDLLSRDSMDSGAL